MIEFIAGLVVGFVVGILVGRRNVKKVNEIVERLKVELENMKNK